jgi:hypothetical protein
MATTTVVTSPAKMVTAANAGSVGDKFLLSDGIHDYADLSAITKSGVTCEPEHPGKATIKGGGIDLKGSSIGFSGFDLAFKHTRDHVMYIWGSQCKVRLNKFHPTNLATTTWQDWLCVRGNDNLIDLNDIYGKTGKGNHILVGEGSAQPLRNRITNNKIHNFHVTNYGTETNGYEFIRIGSSTAREKDFYTEISNNSFYDYNTPESELITIKGQRNLIQKNKFGVDGNVTASVCCRHGGFNTIKDNEFKGTGLRIYGKGHVVTGNNFKRNPLSQLRQIVIGNGRYAEESQNTDATYTQVRDLLFENNTIEMEDSTSNIILCLGYGSYPLKPYNNKFVNNKISGSKGTLANTRDGASWNGNIVSGNQMWATGTAKYGDMPAIGYTKKDFSVVTPPPVVTPPTPIPEPEPIPPQPPATELTLETLDERIKKLEAKVFGTT